MRCCKNHDMDHGDAALLSSLRYLEFVAIIGATADYTLAVVRRATSSALVLMSFIAVYAQIPNVNYDEAKVGTYALPDLLTVMGGAKVTGTRDWQIKRRPELLHLFEKHVYGRSPGPPENQSFESIESDPKAMGGKATRKQIVVHFKCEKDSPLMHLLLYVPNNVSPPVPAFLALNFDGNHAISSDPGITITEQWMWNKKGQREVLVRPTYDSRGKEGADSLESWPVEKILGRGYALATVYYGDLEPDYAEGWRHGVREFLLKQQGRTKFRSDDWGAISAWAWGLSRALDYLETDKDIDASRVAVMGFSRLGKAALWAGAQDERFAIVISNESGEGGAALARRNFGETLHIMNTAFPHWFCERYKTYNSDPSRLPVDQHELIALMAPRPVYVASAEEDLWSDPRGEFLAAKNAEAVYRLFGKLGLGVDDLPRVNTSVGDFIGYHIRNGKHGVTDYDWEQYLRFADHHFRRSKD